MMLVALVSFQQLWLRMIYFRAQRRILVCFSFYNRRFRSPGIEWKTRKWRLLLGKHCRYLVEQVFFFSFACDFKYSPCGLPASPTPNQLKVMT